MPFNDIEDNRNYVALISDGPVTGTLTVGSALGHYVNGLFAAYTLERGYSFYGYKIIVSTDTPGVHKIMAGETGGGNEDRFTLWEHELVAGSFEFGGDARVPLFIWQPWQEGINTRATEIFAGDDHAGTVTRIEVIGWVEP